MARARKTRFDDDINVFVGGRVRALREERGWGLKELAEPLEVSLPYLKALEVGQYSFSSAMLCRIAAVLGCAAGSLLPPEFGAFGSLSPGAVDRSEEWRDLYLRLPLRDRLALIEVGNRLASGGTVGLPPALWRQGFGSGLFISFEGVDGYLLEAVARSTSERLRLETPRVMSHLVWYDFNDSLLRFMVERFQEETFKTNAYRAFERTLLFTCERLQRQQQQILPLLRKGETVLTPFFSLAPSVYQELEQLPDFSFVEAASPYLVEPDVILFIDSDARHAAERAVPHLPGRSTFYSPYSGEESFSRAAKIYKEKLRSLKRERGGVVELLGNDPVALTDAALQAIRGSLAPV